MLEAVFWGSIVLVAFAYFGYPLSLAALALVRDREVLRLPFSPKVTLIITAFNEEQRIDRKLQNTLKLEYPGEKLQIIVASDGSTDQTNVKVAEYWMSGIELVPLKHRRGKEAAQKEAIKSATGEVLVFTDVATCLSPDALKEIVSNFSDPSVGCVSGRDHVTGKDGKPTGEGLYVRYEMWLRNLESSVGSLVGLSGSFFAARKEVCRDFSDEMQSDFGTVLRSVKMQLRGVLDQGAIGSYDDILDEKQEFERKTRTVLRGLTVFFRNLEFLNPLQYGLFSYQFLCHKLLRWFVPLFIAVAFLSSLILSLDSVLFASFLLGQLAFYSLAFLGWRRPTTANIFLKIPTYFLTVNSSIFMAWFRYLIGQRVVMWTPSER